METLIFSSAPPEKVCVSMPPRGLYLSRFPAASRIYPPPAASPAAEELEKQKAAEDMPPSAAVIVSPDRCRINKVFCRCPL